MLLFTHPIEVVEYLLRGSIPFRTIGRSAAWTSCGRCGRRGRGLFIGAAGCKVDAGESFACSRLGGGAMRLRSLGILSVSGSDSAEECGSEYCGDSSHA